MALAHPQLACNLSNPFKLFYMFCMVSYLSSVPVCSVSTWISVLLFCPEFIYVDGYLYSASRLLTVSVFLGESWNLGTSHYFPELTLFLPIPHLPLPASAHWTQAFSLTGETYKRFSLQSHTPGHLFQLIVIPTLTYALSLDLDMRLCM